MHKCQEFYQIKDGFMRDLPSILDQGGSPECSSYAVAGVGNFILNSRGSSDRVDEVVLYNETVQGGGGGQTLGAILAHAQVYGLPLKSGGRKNVQTYTRITAGTLNVKNTLNSGNVPLAVTYQISNGVGFSEGIHAPNYTLQWPLETHSMVICDFDINTSKFWMANSYGTSWGNNGYFWLDGMRMISPYAVDIYQFSLAQ